LANRRRLQILALLVDHGAQTVTSVAGTLQLGLPATSQYLRGLEARGFLVVQRKGRHVRYRLADQTAATRVAPLLSCLRPNLKQGKASWEKVFRAVTAFTHPTRIEIARLLRAKPLALYELQTATGRSSTSVFRQIRKLETRGFVRVCEGVCELVWNKDPLSDTLLHMACDPSIA